MKDVSYDPTSDSITLQPGIHWGEALTALAPLGVAPLGGRLGSVINFLAVISFHNALYE